MKREPNKRSQRIPSDGGSRRFSAAKVEICEDAILSKDDVSERRRGEEARYRLAAIVDSSDDAIVSKSLDGIITSWNEGARRIFGYTAEEMIGESILRLIPKELFHEEDEIQRKLRAGERIDHFETTRLRKDGERIEISVTISPVKDSIGRIIGVSKIARDIGERKRLERLLIQSEKLAATGRMAATIAHEINNPLESVMNLVYLARVCCAGNDKAQQYLSTAENEIERVSHIARRTLGYYRDSARPSKIIIHELLEEVLSVYQTKLQASGIQVACSFNDSHPLEISKGELLQVLSNIIANAIDAMPDGGLLDLQVAESDDMGQAGVRLAIRDEGKGIEQERLPQIFEAFYTTKGSRGNGIGLWVAKQLVERRHGWIAAASDTNPGSSGTTLTIFLPYTDCDAGEESPRVNAA